MHYHVHFTYAYTHHSGKNDRRIERAPLQRVREKALGEEMSSPYFVARMRMLGSDRRCRRLDGGMDVGSGIRMR